MKEANGFTLVEVLISLALIGVLSVVAINTLRNRDMSEEYTTKRDKAVMNIEGVIHQAMFDSQLEELISLSNVTGAINDHLYAGTSNGKSIMRDGTAYSLAEKNEEDYVGELTIDVNGSIEPNIEGQDIYKFLLNRKGNLVPVNN